jgi:tubulin polyglutamylase TTLL1
MKAYFYNEGYMRTSSKQFTLEDVDNQMIHLTNDAVQVNDEDYGKFEMANKLSFTDFQKFLDNYHQDKNIDFKRDLLPQIRTIVTESIRAVSDKVDPYQRMHTFEVFGYDFMIDEDFKIYLIEVNTNPCLDQ